MKRMLYILLMVVLLFTMTVPALAAANMEDDLIQITALVKELLGIKDDYTSFSGNFRDDLRPGWYLEWSDEDGSLNVSCTADGIITEVSCWSDADYRSQFYGFNAAFPAVSEEEARMQAEDLLARLMGENETARIDGVDVSLSVNGNYTFSGTVLVNKLESPIYFSIQIGSDGLRRYYRSDSYSGYVGEIPGAEPAVDANAAARNLAEAVEMELYYVSDGEGNAHLQYVPVGPYTVVDAVTGETIDMDALYASFGGGAVRNGSVSEAAAVESTQDSAAGKGLTEIELASIANYRDVLSQESMDEMLRSVPELGLEGFELTRCSYGMNGENEISAYLYYSCEMTEERLFGFPKSTYDEYISWGDTPVVNKYIEVDAKTGDLVSVSTGYPLWSEIMNEQGSVSAVAESFLERCAGERFEETALCTLKDYKTSDGHLIYAQMHDGYFYPENNMYVVVNSAEGTVDEFRIEWEDVVFGDSEDPVDEDTAKKAYSEALEVLPGYVAWPEDIDYSNPLFDAWIRYGYTWVESLRLAYYYKDTENVSGVDALTGNVISKPADGTFVYSDIGDLPESEIIESLAMVGVGFRGGEFHPDKSVNMRDAAELLLQASGYNTSDWDEDTILRESLWMGFVKTAEWEPEAEITKMEFIRMILGASSYGDAAELDDIWKTGFEDIDDEYTGYAAIARALGMVTGNELRPENICSRTEAAVLLYGFMKR